MAATERATHEERLENAQDGTDGRIAILRWGSFSSVTARAYLNSSRKLASSSKSPPGVILLVPPPLAAPLSPVSTSPSAFPSIPTALKAPECDLVMPVEAARVERPARGKETGWTGSASTAGGTRSGVHGRQMPSERSCARLRWLTAPPSQRGRPVRSSVCSGGARSADPQELKGRFEHLPGTRSSKLIVPRKQWFEAEGTSEAAQSNFGKRARREEAVQGLAISRLAAAHGPGEADCTLCVHFTHSGTPRLPSERPFSAAAHSRGSRPTALRVLAGARRAVRPTGAPPPAQSPVRECCTNALRACEEGVSKCESSAKGKRQRTEMQREVLDLEAIRLAVLGELATEARDRVDELVADLEEKL